MSAEETDSHTEKMTKDHSISADEKYKMLFEQMYDAAFLADTETGIIIDANPRAAELLGRPLEEVIGLDQTRLHPPGEESRYKTLFLEHVQQIGQGHLEGEVLHKDGSRIPVSISARMFKLNGKSVILGLFRNITERRKAEAAITRAARMEATASLAAGIAHNFNNLMFAVLGNVRLLEGKYADSESRQMLADIHQAAERGSELARKMLTFARSGVHKSETVDLRKLLQKIVLEFQAETPERISFEADLPETFGSTQADPGGVRIIIENLLSNAVEAIQGTGQIKISLSTVEISEDSIREHRFEREGFYALLTIHDTGRGIEDSVAEKIFEPFFSTKLLGRGLGLAVVHGIVKKHRGEILFRNNPDGGTIFEVYLPLI